MVDGVNQQGLFQRIGNFFGSDDPNAGQSTDPFAGLSRAQRTMLGFSALRDAAASLEGRDSNFFAQSLGGFESARERERLREQGATQSRVQALQALATLNEQMRYNQAFGLPADPATDALRSTLMEMAGFGAGSALGVTLAAGSMPTTVAPTTRLPTGGAVIDASGAVVGDVGDEPLSPAAQAAMEGAPVSADGRDFNAERQAIFNAMQQRMYAGAGVSDLQAQLDNLNAQEAAATAATAAADVEAADISQTAAQAEGLLLPEVNEAFDFLVRGFDAEGNPIFNPALVTRAGRLVSGALEGPEYQNYAGAIETLKTGVLLEALANATVGALSDGERAALSAAQGDLNPNNPIGTYRALQRIERVAQQSIERRNREAGIGAGASVPSVSWD
jgi:hypothetical protein